eukprot:GHUV01010692.1.p3 GENE.GHUV01010692.1~~GHUV01010692.1.p3  ORF type:complete len:101 (-),score=9.55 GHUV01010692.1:1690-1992(-)
MSLYTRIAEAAPPSTPLQIHLRSIHCPLTVSSSCSFKGLHVTLHPHVCMRLAAFATVGFAGNKLEWRLVQYSTTMLSQTKHSDLARHISSRETAVHTIQA